MKNMVSTGFAPNGVEMFDWEENGVKYTQVVVYFHGVAEVRNQFAPRPDLAELIERWQNIGKTPSK